MSELETSVSDTSVFDTSESDTSEESETSVTSGVVVVSGSRLSLVILR